ncbi:XrtA/PEP-CTERM system TPR-repeat protein PrsT [Thiohalocapsa sp. ML1]|uniref:XrtA/PEP-CTERM system TPR-repeat protein PrsT n=1 Tax=Thiohalocapsa sp. ML1 TaxID=1431688 RepID=UPI000A9B1A03|nr:XrtA/PEP-CTERM system TPR-repeat protein PrsT [Thiohalocapsa sp. ML1]
MSRPTEARVRARRYTLLAIAFAIVVAAPLGAATALDDADADWAAGNVQSAVVRLKDALQQDPDNAAARLLLGRIYLDSGDMQAAEQELTRARDAGADDIATRIALAEALLGQGELSRALEWTEPPLQATAAERAELLALRGSVLLSQEQEDEAAAAFSAAVDADANALRAMLGMATLELRRGDAEAARATLTHATKLHAESAHAWQALGGLEQLSGQREAALAAYSRAIEQARSPWPLQYQRAIVHLDLGNKESAAADIEAVRRARARLPGLDYLDGRLLLLQGDAAAAADKLEHYLSGAPSDLAAIYFAALALNGLERHAQAEEYLVRLTAAMPNNPQVAGLLARTRLALGNAAGAEAAIRPFAEHAEATPVAMELLRQALVRQARADEAEQLVSRAAERFPDLASAQLAHAQQLLDSKDAAGAVDLLRRVVDTEPANERARMLLMRSLLARGDTDAAMAAADAFLAKSPDSPMAHTATGALLAQQGDIDGARSAFAAALERDPSFDRAALALAALELGSERPEQAREALDGLLAANPDSVAATLASAAMDRRDGGDAAFRERLRDALAQNPDALQLRLVLARSELAAGNADAARTLLNQAPPQQRDATPVLLLRAETELESGQHTIAAATLSTLVQRNPTMARFPYMLASLHAQTGDLAAATGSLTEGLMLDRDAELEHERLARILAAQPTAEARKSLLERLLRLAPEHPVVRAAQARFLLAERDFDAAMQMLRELAGQHPDDAVYTLWLADAQDTAGRRPEARRLLTDWLTTHPDQPAVRLSLAQLAISDVDYAEAIAQYRRVLDQTPNNRVALNNLAMLLADSNPDEALGYAERALAQAPEDAAYIDTKGTVLLAKGDAAAALPLLAKAHAGSQDPGIAYRYAKALAATGDKPGARRVLLAVQAQAYPEKADADALLQTLVGGN